MPTNEHQLRAALSYRNNKKSLLRVPVVGSSYLATIQMPENQYDGWRYNRDEQSAERRKSPGHSDIHLYATEQRYGYDVFWQKSSICTVRIGRVSLLP